METWGILINAMRWIAVFILPFVSFFFGVLISIRLDLNRDVPAKIIWLMAVPVGLITIGNMLLMMSVESEVVIEGVLLAEKQYGHASSLPQYFVFTGTIILYGTLVPQLFAQARARLRDSPRSDEDLDQQTRR